MSQSPGRVWERWSSASGDTKIERPSFFKISTDLGNSFLDEKCGGRQAIGEWEGWGRETPELALGNKEQQSTSGSPRRNQEKRRA